MNAKLTNEASSRLTPVETEVIEFFIEIACALGQRRSYARIYGLLFISPTPLTMRDIYERLQISKGGASMGLQFLREIGAVRELEAKDSRYTHYAAMVELGQLAGRLLRDQMAPQLAGSEARLARLVQLMGDLPMPLRGHSKNRISSMRSWNRNSRKTISLAVKLLGS